MNLFLADPQYRNWAATEGHVKALFGLSPKAKWPAEGVPRRDVQGILCWVEPLRERRPGLRRPNFGLRAMAQCPACARVVAIGRLKQHSRVHP